MGSGDLRPLLIVKTGRADEAVRSTHGDFEDWITAVLDLPVPTRVEVCDVTTGARLPRPGTMAAAVVTGSAAMVTWRQGWMERTAAWLAGAVVHGLPVLGICFGHQLLAHALGGVVGPNPRGREVGTKTLSLRPASLDDPLLSGHESPVTVQTTHVEAVLELPPGAVLLASTDHDPYHVFRWGGSAWGVQFHPEFTAEVMRAYLTTRRRALAAEGLDVDGLLGAVRPSDAGPEILRRIGRLASARAAA